jgi:hypothetical protein
MIAIKRALSLLIGCCALISASSCISSKAPPVILPLVIAKAPLPAAVINVPYSATLTAGGGVQPYTWAIASGTLPPGLSISSSGVINGTPTALGNTTFKIQVTDSQTPTAAVDVATKSITVNQPIAISTQTLTDGSVGVPYSAVLVAVGGVPPYTWSLTSGTLPAGVSVSAAGVISGTPTNQETQTFTVQAADSQTPPSTATASLTLTIGGPTSRLNGNYIFSFSGFQNGSLVLQAGSFKADGQGNITGGIMDSNSSTGVHTKLSFTGTYSIGAGNTGPMALVVPGLGSFTYQISVPASGTPRFIQNGTGGNQGTGYFSKVTSPTKLTIAQLANTWTYGATGADAAGNRYATAGTFVADNKGVWSNLEEDANDNGTVSHSTTNTGSFLAIDPLTGRGTASMTAGGVTTNYSFYAASSVRLVMLSVDPVSGSAPLALFSVFNNPGNWSTSTLNSTTVVQMSGLGNSGGSAVPYGLLAFATFDGKGGLTIATDENTGGTMSANKYTATYSTASNGRTTVSGFGADPVVIYFSGSLAFLLNSDTGVTTGTLVPQFSPPYTNTSIDGSYQGATLQTVATSVTVENDSGSADGAGNLALTYDISGPGGPQQGLTQASTYSVDSVGRTPLVVSSNTVGIAYVVNAASGVSGAGKLLVLSTDANPKINSLEK